MNLKIIFAVCLLAYTVSAADLDVNAIIDAQQQLVKVMVASLSERAPISPEESSICFQRATAEQEKITNDYNRRYNGCSDIADSSRQKLTEASFGVREDILSRSRASCAALESCSDDFTYSFFGCYNGVARQVYPDIYELAVDAEAQEAVIDSQLQVIEGQLNACITTARNEYNENSYVCSKTLQSCLAGNGWPTTTVTPPTTITPEPTTPTTEPTTESPETTTEEPEQPTTTEEPEQPTTTEEPEQPTTTEEPEQPTTTEEPQQPSTTEEPEVPSTTEEPEQPSTTEEPEQPTTTEEPEQPTTTEEPQQPSTTEEPEVTTEYLTTEAVEERSPEEDLRFRRRIPKFRLF